MHRAQALQGAHFGPYIRMLSLKALSCLKIVLRQFSRCFLASFVLEFTHTATKESFPKTTYIVLPSKMPNIYQVFSYYQQ